MDIVWKTRLGGTCRPSKVHGVDRIIIAPKWVRDIFPGAVLYITYCGIGWRSFHDPIPKYKQRRNARSVDCKRCRVTHHYREALMK